MFVVIVSNSEEKENCDFLAVQLLRIDGNE